MYAFPLHLHGLLCFFLASPLPRVPPPHPMHRWERIDLDPFPLPGIDPRSPSIERMDKISMGVSCFLSHLGVVPTNLSLVRLRGEGS